MFQVMIWAGAGLTLAGLVALIWCILGAIRIRRENLPEDQLRTALMRLVPVNMGAMFLSVIGLMLVVIGVILD